LLVTDLDELCNLLLARMFNIAESGQFIGASELE